MPKLHFDPHLWLSLAKLLLGPRYSLHALAILNPAFAEMEYQKLGNNKLLLYRLKVQCAYNERERERVFWLRCMDSFDLPKFFQHMNV